MKAYFTLVSNEYVPGAVALIKSLKKHTNIPIHFIDIDLTEENILRLESLGGIREKVKKLRSLKAKYKEWHINEKFANNCFNKLHVWNFDYETVVYLDSDTIVVKSIDHLFDLPYPLAACPVLNVDLNLKTRQISNFRFDPNRFNSGVMVIKPDKITFKSMIENKDIVETYDGADQGFLNNYFKKWHALNCNYNVTKRVYKFTEIWNKIKDDVFVYHFTTTKPWIKLEDPMDELWQDVYYSI